MCIGYFSSLTDYLIQACFDCRKVVSDSTAAGRSWLFSIRKPLFWSKFSF
jgi:hypothetical protein